MYSLSIYLISIPSADELFILIDKSNKHLRTPLRNIIADHLIQYEYLRP